MYLGGNGIAVFPQCLLPKTHTVTPHCGKGESWNSQLQDSYDVIIVTSGASVKIIVCMIARVHNIYLSLYIMNS